MNLPACLTLPPIPEPDRDAKSLFVTRSCLPPLEDYIEVLTGIWDRNQLTNGGPLVGT